MSYTVAMGDMLETQLTALCFVSIPLTCLFHLFRDPSMGFGASDKKYRLTSALLSKIKCNGVKDKIGKKIGKVCQL